MDSRHPAPHPFSRPHSQSQSQVHTLSNETRFGPIPPPPYHSQSSVLRQDPPPRIDPFLPRRPTHDTFATTTTRPDNGSSYGFPQGPSIPPSLFAPTISSDSNDGGMRRGSYGSNLAYTHTAREEQDVRKGSGTLISQQIQVLLDSISPLACALHLSPGVLVPLWLSHFRKPLPGRFYLYKST